VALRSTESSLLAAVAGLGATGVADDLHPDVRDALRAHVVVDALYRSAASGGAAVGVPAGLPDRGGPGAAV
jgi:hypothetical protein